MIRSYRSAQTPPLSLLHVNGSHSQTMNSYIVDPNDLILITGASGFIGSRVVTTLINMGFTNIRCLVRPSGRSGRLAALVQRSGTDCHLDLFEGNLLSRDACRTATAGATLIYHLAAGTGSKSFPEAVMNSVVATRNLLEAAKKGQTLRRVVNISSFTVYTNSQKSTGTVLDESCPIEALPKDRGDAYCYGKVKQDELVEYYGRTHSIPYVIVRPGYVYGPGKHAISGRVGIDTFGCFLHMGGFNKLPFTYVDNCAEAIVLAGLQPGINGQVFNIVDDELPSSRHFLRLYKKNVRHFRSYYVPHFISYGFCWLWEAYSRRSQGQLPPVFTRKRWYVDWKRTTYSNQKLKALVGWTPRVPLSEGLRRYFADCNGGETNA